MDYEITILTFNAIIYTNQTRGKKHYSVKVYVNCTHKVVVGVVKKKKCCSWFVIQIYFT